MSLPQSKLSNADTILNVTYENGALNSGITGVTATHASAADAAYMINPADNGSNYAIAHKIVHGDSAYWSDGSDRSESDAIAVQNARFFPGDERRYEFSVLLKNIISSLIKPYLICFRTISAGELSF